MVEREEEVLGGYCKCEWSHEKVAREKAPPMGMEEP